MRIVLRVWDLLDDEGSESFIANVNDDLMNDSRTSGIVLDEVMWSPPDERHHIELLFTLDQDSAGFYEWLGCLLFSYPGLMFQVEEIDIEPLAGDKTPCPSCGQIEDHDQGCPHGLGG